MDTIRQRPVVKDRAWVAALNARLEARAREFEAWSRARDPYWRRKLGFLGVNLSPPDKACDPGPVLAPGSCVVLGRRKRVVNRLFAGCRN